MTDSTLEAASATFLRLQALLIQANQAQWEAGMTPALREDTSERSKGMTSDPVPHIVADTRRLKLRDAFVEAERAQALMLKTLSAAANHLESALSANG
jgi:hypothetical protein